VNCYFFIEKLKKEVFFMFSVILKKEDIIDFIKNIPQKDYSFS